MDNIPSSAFAFLLSTLAIAQVGCSGNSPKSETSPPAIATSHTLQTHLAPASIQQYIPAAYYACTATSPEALCNAYFSRYFNIADAEIQLNNQTFVFKNMGITDSELHYSTADYIWIDGIIQCYFLNSGDARFLKGGDFVDIVGIDSGPNRDYLGTLIFTGCIFLPAGSVELPAGGGSGLVIPGY